MLSPSRRALVLAGAFTALALALVPTSLPAAPLGWLGAGVLALAAADAFRVWREPAPEVVRALPDRAYVGAALDVCVRARRRSSRAVSLLVLEAPPRASEAERDTLTFALESDAPVEARYALTPRRRGDLRFGRAVVFAASPLGLWRRRLAVTGDDELRVYPDARRLLRSRAIDPRHTLQLLGAKPAPRRGEGLDFESLRDYVHGDDPRRIDWAASARRGRPVVRQYQHEQNHDVVIAIDTSRLMAAQIAWRTKLDHAVDAALVLGYAGLLSGDRIALALFDSEVRGFLPARNRRRDLGALLEFVRSAQPRAVEPDFESFVRGLATRQRRRSVVIVLTDFVEVEATPLLRAFAVLARRHRVLLVTLRDPVLREAYPDAPNADGSERALLRRLVLGDLVHHREQVLLGLRRSAVQTIDLPPDEITGEALNRYLAMRREA